MGPPEVETRGALLARVPLPGPSVARDCLASVWVGRGLSLGPSRGPSGGPGLLMQSWEEAPRPAEPDSVGLLVPVDPWPLLACSLTAPFLLSPGP